MSSNSQVKIDNHHNNDNSQTRIDDDRQLTHSQLYLCAVIIGIFGGMVATIYYFVLEAMMHGVWHTLPEIFKLYFPSWFGVNNYVLIATTVGGFLVGLALYFFGLPGEMAEVVDNIHEPGKIDIRKTPSMIVTSLIAITSGGSAGPEAPLVQVNGSFGSWLGDKLKLTKTSVRILTFCGMSAALGAFFGTDWGGFICLRNSSSPRFTIF